MKALAIAGGIILLVLGAVSMLTPFPGALLLAAGVAILIGLSPRVRSIVRGRRQRWGWLHSYMLWLERKAPQKLSDALIQTRPDVTEAD